MFGWLILAAYVVGWFVSLRLIAGHFAFEYSSYPDGEEIVVALLVGALCACVWPLLWPCWAIYRRGWLMAAGVGLIRVPARERVRRLEYEAREREYRIAQLEREAGLR